MDADKKLLICVAKFLLTSGLERSLSTLKDEANLKVKEKKLSSSSTPDLKLVFQQWLASQNDNVQATKDTEPAIESNAAEVKKEETVAITGLKRKKKEEVDAPTKKKARKDSKDASAEVSLPVSKNEEKKKSKSAKKGAVESTQAVSNGSAETNNSTKEKLGKSKKAKPSVAIEGNDDSAPPAAETASKKKGGKKPSAPETEEAADGKEEEEQEVTVAEKEAEEDHSSKKGESEKSPGSASRAFQRVKVEEVTFKDTRLKDNSYWAKSGAESGWGSKAQEILGQVRGKDFRHEKTKKKRGTYRGGVIDFQSHSIKFNDSDDE